ncbi:homoserine dehydrogenase [Geitlerinema sp. PCC 9228]|uniref:homoserine dehydrogenase n=1 Tax=Geitlerinema sp. PCC 9228 TaxID=111611 RepID=UPI0008F9AABB|nr:homoserine dehydrogenase [Geitlerinema sp. PCC 9228]
MAFKIGLLGLGTVGTGTAKILLDPQGRHPLLQELKLHRVGVNSLDKPREVQLPAGVLQTDLTEIVTDPDIEIVVELLGGLEPARSLILKAIEHRKHVVTANKAVISRYGNEIFQAANEAGVYVLLEAAVAGGIPAIAPLTQSLVVNRIQSITGIVNGTTNYILSRMQTEGAGFEGVLAQAQALGYAEADPTADVDGYDAADKIAILASLAYSGEIDLEAVHREGIRQINATDISYADRLGFAVKLLAIAKPDPTQDTYQRDRLQVRVHPTLVPKDHPLASVNGVNNAIVVEGDPLGQVVFSGPGAGAGATASAVTADILNIAATLKVEELEAQTLSQQFPDQQPRTKVDVPHPLLSCQHQHACQIVPMEDLVTRFYARVLSPDRPGVIGKVGTCFGKFGVSLESVVQIDRKGEIAEIVVITHDVREGDFRQALAELVETDPIDSIPSVLRVL